MDIKGEINSNTVTVGDFNNLLISMDRSSREKINKETALKWHPGSDGFIDVFRAFHPKAAGYTFFSSAHETFSRIDHMLGQKVSINLRRLKSYQASSLTTTIWN